MIRYKCGRCGAGMESPDGLAGQHEQCPKCGASVRVPAEPTAPLARAVDQRREETRKPAAAPPLIVPSSAPRRRGNWIKRYKRRCGTRSFIFQCIVLAWTLFMGLIALGLMMASLPDRGSRASDAEIGAWGFMGICCPCATWILVALPFGIAALATLESGRTQENVS